MFMEEKLMLLCSYSIEHFFFYIIEQNHLIFKHPYNLDKEASSLFKIALNYSSKKGIKKIKIYVNRI